MSTTQIETLCQKFPVALWVLLMGYVGVDLLLLGIGVLWQPSAFSIGFFPAVFMQVIYGASAWFGLRHSRDPLERRFGLIFGLLIATVFVSEIIAELLITIDNNTPLANAEYGTVFLLLIVVGCVTTWQSGNVLSGIKTAVWAALLGSLIWYGSVLATYYLFHDSPHQQQAFAAEGTFDDFRQSGMTDFAAFVLQDFWGAGFFHLLFAPFFALMLGGVGASIGWMSKRLLKPMSGESKPVA